MHVQPSSSLSIQHVSKCFTNAHNNTELPVLEDINLDIEAGEFISIVGASGCGKSTLLRLILGLDTHFSGHITLNQQAISGPGLDRGIVFQDHRLLPWLTVEQNVFFALRNSHLSPAEQREQVQQHLQLVGLKGFEQHLPSAISGGMAQRVAIARGLVNRPQVLLLDEPLGALDALTRSRLQQEIQDIQQSENITMILVTHDVDEAVFLADRVVVMQPNPGRIHEIVSIDLPRPRNRSEPQFIHYRDHILQYFSASDFDTKPAIATSSHTPSRLRFAY